jgi:hypothetical protein
MPCGHIIGAIRDIMLKPDGFDWKCPCVKIDPESTGIFPKTLMDLNFRFKSKLVDNINIFPFPCF